MRTEQPDGYGDRPERHTGYHVPAGGADTQRRPRPARPWLTAGLILLVGLCGAVVIWDFRSAARADQPVLPGVDLPAADLAAVNSAALSCPALTGPRLAAEIMAASGFGANATPVALAATSTAKAVGIGGLTSKDWMRWAPWPKAAASDRRANITAVAHLTCDLVGRLRAAKVPGDPWQTAVGALRAGLPAVVAANGIPGTVASYVDTVAGYATWYAQQPQFGGSGGGPTSSPAPGPEARQVPDGYLAAVQAAGATCPQITPARVAGQLMATSGFDPNKLGTAGEQGIAQFTPQTWSGYAAGDASPWNPDQAISTLGTAMCDLVRQAGAITTGDPYPLALAAYQWGLPAVRSAGGVPRSTELADFIRRVQSYTAGYQRDQRLGGPAPATTASPSVRSGSPLAPTGPTPTGPAGTVALPGGLDPGKTYEVSNSYLNQVLDLPGDDWSTGAGVAVDLWPTQHAKDQRWRVSAARTAGYLTITSALSGKVLAIRDGATGDGAALDVVDANPADPNQQWQLRDAGNGAFWIVNGRSGKALDITGDDTAAGNGYPVQQWSPQAQARDQRWTFVG